MMYRNYVNFQYFLSCFIYGITLLYIFLFKNLNLIIISPARLIIFFSGQEVFYFMNNNKNYLRVFTSQKNLDKFINLFPIKLLSDLINKYESDYRIKVFFTEKFFMLNIFTRLLKSNNITLRSMIEFSNSYIIKTICKFKEKISLSGLSDRQNDIPAEMFSELLLNLVKLSKPVSNKLKKEFNKIKIFDTTFIMLSLKLFSWITKCNQTNKGTLKIGLRIDDNQTIPDKIVFEFKNTNDNLVFEKLLNLTKKGITYLFDRGFHAIKIIGKIHLSNNFFITRMYPTYKVKVKKNLPFSKKENSNEATKIIKDQLVYIGAGKNQFAIPFRLITALNLETNEIVLFLTNRMDLSPLDVCLLYKHRWQIELLFKWLKQYLKINKLIARSLNGVLVQIYVVMIIHMLLLLYRQLHKVNIPLLKVLRNLEILINNAFAEFMFSLGASSHNKIKLRKNDLFPSEVLC